MPDAAAPVIDVQGLTHRYASAPRAARRGAHAAPKPAASAPSSSSRRPALDNVSLQINPGEIFAVLGPNGGGKTTLFKILATMLRPNAGQVRVFGVDALAQPDAVRRKLGVVFQSPSLDSKLTAQENLLHQGHLYGLSGRELQTRIDAALTAVSLADRRDERVEHFSGGMRRRVELAKSMLHRPRLLLLDEPATGLDPGSRREVWTHLERLRSQTGVTIALTTHLMDEADRCDRLAIISRGKVVAVNTPANLKSSIGGDVISIEPEDASDPASVEAFRAAIEARFAPWPAGRTPVVSENTIQIERPDGAAFVAILASAFPGKIRRISVGRPTLEAVFLQLTGHQLSGDE